MYKNKPNFESKRTSGYTSSSSSKYNTFTSGNRLEAVSFENPRKNQRHEKTSTRTVITSATLNIRACAIQVNPLITPFVSFSLEDKERRSEEERDTHSNSRGSKTRSFPRISAVIVCQIQKCGKVPSKREEEPKKKPNIKEVGQMNLLLLVQAKTRQ